jgi:hypothetical protein
MLRNPISFYLNDGQQYMGLYLDTKIGFSGIYGTLGKKYVLPKMFALRRSRHLMCIFSAVLSKPYMERGYRSDDQCVVGASD